MSRTFSNAATPILTKVSATAFTAPVIESFQPRMMSFPFARVLLKNPTILSQFFQIRIAAAIAAAMPRTISVIGPIATDNDPNPTIKAGRNPIRRSIGPPIRPRAVAPARARAAILMKRGSSVCNRSARFWICPSSGVRIGRSCAPIASFTSPMALPICLNGLAFASAAPPTLARSRANRSAGPWASVNSMDVPRMRLVTPARTGPIVSTTLFKSLPVSAAISIAAGRAASASSVDPRTGTSFANARICASSPKLVFFWSAAVVAMIWPSISPNDSPALAMTADRVERAFSCSRAASTKPLIAMTPPAPIADKPRPAVLAPLDIPSSF